MEMDLYGDSDVESLSDTSSDDQDDIFSIYSGHAQSILSSLEDSIGKIDDFLSFERSFMHGDIVCSTGNPSGQMGRIIKVDMTVDLESVFGEVIKNVNSGKLLRMRSISVGDYVIHGPWVGRVEKVVDTVGILFDDGTKCEILATDTAKLSPLSPNLLDDSLYLYHPGQRVKVGPPSRPGGWFCGASKRSLHEGIVSSVEVGLVYVEWISSAIVGVSTTLPPPARIQDAKNLTLLSCFSHEHWQLGDWCILAAAEQSNGNGAAQIPRPDLGVHGKLPEMFSIVKRKIKVDVMWQDGTSTSGLDSQTLFPASVVNAHDFFPGQFVLEKTGSDEQIASMNRKCGVVKCVDANERTVKAKWINTDRDTKGFEDSKIEVTVSAYELVEHPDFSFNSSDIVFTSDKFNRMGMEDATPPGNKYCHTDLSDIQKKSFLSCIGHVIGLKDGAIEVQLASGVTTQFAPYMVLRMEKDDGSVAAHVLQEEIVAQFNGEKNGRQPVEHEELLDPNSGDAVTCQSDYRNCRLLSLSQAAVGFLTGVATIFFRSPGTMLLAESTSCAHIIDKGKAESFDGQDILESCGMISHSSMLDSTSFDATVSRISKQKVKETTNNLELPSAEDKGLGQFKQFDVVDDCSDHHFVDSDGKGSGFSQMRKGWLNKVQQEWSILEKDLPDTIYVRIYEERMDLLRAAIVGAPGTPYHDGLFFFDILLPPDYPHVPPLVHYHSGGLRLNPNLYESGKVCLSLLNTWNGTGTEVWTPGSSTILQVLLSLQALVLNEKPYFNEAGYDDQIGRAEGEKNSVSYNENAYLGTCKCILYQLRNPPKHFEGLVEEHFDRRFQNILSACKAYMEGAPIGLVGRAEHKKGNSTGFKIMLAKLFPKLVEAFSNKGLDCSRFIETDK